MVPEDIAKVLDRMKRDHGKWHKSPYYCDLLGLLPGLNTGGGPMVREIVNMLRRRGEPILSSVEEGYMYVAPEDREWARGVALKSLLSLQRRLINQGASYVELLKSMRGVFDEPKLYLLCPVCSNRLELEEKDEKTS